MNMKFLTLNCQRGHQAELQDFLRNILDAGTYDFLLLQEADQKVLSFLEHPAYKLARAFNEEVGQISELCIVYRSAYKLIQQNFQSFASMRNDPWRGFKHPSFAVLSGTFDMNGKPVRVGSVHLHSGIDRQARLAELAKAKSLLLKGASMPTIFSGDFNAGYPGEARRMAKYLAPEFIWPSQGLGPTLDSRYSENLPHLPNRIAAFFGFFNIRIPLWTDHFFTNQTIASGHTIKCRVLPDRVSDHSPIEFSLDPI